MAEVPVVDLAKRSDPAAGDPVDLIIFGSQDQERRVELLDEIRGICVLAMVIYHFFFVCMHQFGMEWAEACYDFLTPLQPIFAAVFILISGICTRLSADLKKRTLVLFVLALSITMITTLLMPALGFEPVPVWFGIIHLLAVSYLLVMLGKKLIDKLPTIIGTAISLGLFFFTAPVSQHYMGMFGLRLQMPDVLYETNALFFLGFHTTGFTYADYFPLLPYFFLFLFGAFMGKLVRNDKTKDNLPEFCYKKHMLPFGFLGRHALKIYLLHVPVFYGVGYLLHVLFSMTG